ncbi:MAG: class I SAM-dependent methyltransferase [Candidatus Woesearchaeota archaeon]
MSIGSNRSEARLHKKIISFYSRDSNYFNKVLNRKESEYRAVITIIRGLLPKNARIIDIGCGTGNLLHFLKKAGYSNIEGLELSKRFTNYCIKKGFTIHQKDVLTYKSKNRYNCVIATDLLEHSIDPDKVYEAMSELLLPGGIMIVQGPNLLQLISRKSRNRLKTTLLFGRKILEWAFCSPKTVYLQPRIDSQTYLNDDSDACYLVNPFDIRCFARYGGMKIHYISTFYNPMARFTKFKKCLVFIVEKLPLLNYMGGTIFVVATKAGDVCNKKPLTDMLRALY